MIVKGPSVEADSADPRRRAGAEGERQMAFYLHRAFAKDDAVLVLNDLRLVDPEQPEPDGSPGVAQIDHLALHRFGAFIIESKSIAGEVVVKPDGSGGDEWARRFGGTFQGMPSPIQQARRQADLLRSILQTRRTELLGKVAAGLRLLAKLVAGTDQRGFGGMPIQVIVAISDGGRIERKNGWREPEGDFATFVTKADLVPEKIRAELERHRAASNPLSKPPSQYGQWSMSAEECEGVARFLLERHTPARTAVTTPPAPIPARTPAAPAPAPVPPPAPKPPAALGPTAPRCKSCGGQRLTAMWGKYGYYWKCEACGTNTAMPVTCSACGAEGRQGQTVRIRKESASYYRRCEACGIDERIWTQPSPAAGADRG